MDEVKEILKYKRPNDCWLCPYCDTENNVYLGRCSVCGCEKNASAMILKQWTETDEIPVTPPPKKKVNTSDNISEPEIEKAPKEDSVSEKDKDNNKNKIVWGILIAIIIIGLIIAATQGSSYGAYSDAMNEFNSGNYEYATELFEGLPSSYKDVSYMIDESKYQTALQYMSSGDFTSAESLFESISYHNDSAEKITECKYQTASSLFNSGNYTEAKSKFHEISSYSDAAEMENECDYQLAMSYKSGGDYVNAMKVFYSISAYKDSSSQFSNSEALLKQYNSKNGYYSTENSLVGDWRDSSGKGVTYKNNGDGSMDASYDMGYTEGEFFKVSNSIHYHGNDYSGWNKQWIYQRIDANNVAVYNYIDGKVYYLSKN